MLSDNIFFFLILKAITNMINEINTLVCDIGSVYKDLFITKEAFIEALVFRNSGDFDDKNKM